MTRRTPIFRSSATWTPFQRSRCRRGFSSLIAEAHNNLAWLLATCPNTELRDPPEALRLARRAVEVEPQQGNFWNTLGVAFYRAGELDDAKKALEKSLELRNAGDSFDWFFLALVDRKKGEDEQAREWYDKAVVWYQSNRPNDQELFQFNVEAAGALGLTKPTLHANEFSVGGVEVAETRRRADLFKPSIAVTTQDSYDPTLTRTESAIFAIDSQVIPSSRIDTSG